jgi:hypothetical protein
MTESKKPTHIAYHVRDYKAGERENSDWTRVGAAWQHEDGDGINIEILDGLAVTGRIVLRKNKPKDKAAA